MENCTKCELNSPDPTLKVRDAEVDALLAKDLNGLSLKERNQLSEEIHVVDPVIPESPDFIRAKTKAILQSIQGIQEKPAFLLARTLSDYVTSELFLLMFLRSERFDEQKSAQRLINFLEEKERLFGNGEVMGRPLRLSDLSKDDEFALRSGMYQILPTRDSTGRAIVLDFRMILPRAKSYKNPIHIIRMSFYMCQALVESDIETQRRGIVAVLYYVGKFTGDYDMESSRRSIENLPKLPVRVNSVHFCLDDPRLQPVTNLAMMLVGKDIRMRFRIHIASHAECQYELMTYGIPIEALPITAKGVVKKTNCHQWITRQQYKETYLIKHDGKHFGGIDLPRPFDVLLRRGQVFQRHPGNFRMRILVESHQDDYKEAESGKKAEISRSIIQQLQSMHNSRFLAYEAGEEGDTFDNGGGLGWWWELSNEEATKRVSKAIRSARSTKAKARRVHQESTEESSERLELKRFKSDEQRCCVPCLSMFNKEVTM